MKPRIAKRVDFRGFMISRNLRMMKALAKTAEAKENARPTSRRTGLGLYENPSVRTYHLEVNPGIYELKRENGEESELTSSCDQSLPSLRLTSNMIEKGAKAPLIIGVLLYRFSSFSTLATATTPSPPS